MSCVKIAAAGLIAALWALPARAEAVTPAAEAFANVGLSLRAPVRNTGQHQPLSLGWVAAVGRVWPLSARVGLGFQLRLANHPIGPRRATGDLSAGLASPNGWYGDAAARLRASIVELRGSSDVVFVGAWMGPGFMTNSPLSGVGGLELGWLHPTGGGLPLTLALQCESHVPILRNGSPDLIAFLPSLTAGLAF